MNRGSIGAVVAGVVAVVVVTTLVDVVLHVLGSGRRTDLRAAARRAARGSPEAIAGGPRHVSGCGRIEARVVRRGVDRMKAIPFFLLVASLGAGCTAEREPVACAAYAAAGLGVSVTDAGTACRCATHR